MTISDEDLKELKSCIYHDLAEMLRRQDLIGADGFGARNMLHRELTLWAIHGGDPDLDETK